MVNIRNRWNSEIVIYESETAVTIKEAVVSANLRGADLTGADLRGANLTGADLRDADLRDADLTGADLRGANLTGANLTGADLTGADLRDADLRGADLRDADLRDADLTGADLTGEDLTPIRDDVWAVLSSAPKEAQGLLDALRCGRVDGSTYTGRCACLVGTIANCANLNYEELPVLKPDVSRPAERFFLAIREGDTPETSQACLIAAGWVSQWIDSMRDAFALSENK